MTRCSFPVRYSLNAMRHGGSTAWYEQPMRRTRTNQRNVWIPLHLISPCRSLALSHRSGPFPITRLNASTKDLPGFLAVKSKNLNNCLSTRLGSKVSLKLSRPTINGQYCAVGTEDPDEMQHFLIVADLNRTEKMSDDPIVSWCQPTEVRPSSALRNHFCVDLLLHSLVCAAHPRYAMDPTEYDFGRRREIRSVIQC